MGWDRKKRGSSTGYYYRSVRTPTGVKKQYLGRSDAAHEAASALQTKRHARTLATLTIRDEQNAMAEAEQWANALFDWTELLLAIGLTSTGHHYHAGEWRKRHGQGPTEKSKKATLQ